MRVVVLNSQVPFLRGGAEVLADGLVAQIEARGHNAALVRIPFQWHPSEMILRHIFACRLLRITAADPDLVIALKFPVYFVPFENKKLWLLHQFRQIYELWGTPFQELPDTPEGHRIRDAIIDADQCHLPEAKQIYTISKGVAERLQKYNHIEADGVLYPPVPNASAFHGGAYDDYFLYMARLTASKRQTLAIEALRFTRTPVKLILAGAPDTDSYLTVLQRLAEQHGVADRVHFTGWISDAEKIALTANALAVLNIPFDEDFGYGTLEAFHSHKAVITLRDSGGPTELIEPEVSGLSLEPTPQALAAALDRVWEQRQYARDMGEMAYQSLEKLNIGWTRVVEALLT